MSIFASSVLSARLRLGAAAVSGTLLALALPAAAAIPAAWTPTGSMEVPRAAPRLVLLGDGEALVAGGLNQLFASYRSAELFNPKTGTWSATGSMKVPRASFVLQRLRDGAVLAAGGCHSAGNCATLTASAELYHPKSGKWKLTGSMPSPREGASSVIFPKGPLAGDVLVAGGCCRGKLPLASALLYDPRTGRWSKTGSMHAARLGTAITLLRSGKVLVSGGNGAAGNVLATAELYDSSSGTLAIDRVNDHRPVGASAATAEGRKSSCLRWVPGVGQCRAVRPQDRNLEEHRVHDRQPLGLQLDRASQRQGACRWRRGSYQ